MKKKMKLYWEILAVLATKCLGRGMFRDEI